MLLLQPGSVEMPHLTAFLRNVLITEAYNSEIVIILLLSAFNFNLNILKNRGIMLIQVHYPENLVIPEYFNDIFGLAE